MSFLCYEAGYCFCTVNQEALVSGVSFYPLTPPFSSLDSSDHFLREGVTQQKCREIKEWILSYEFQRLRLEITPRAGEKIREREGGEVGGEGAGAGPGEATLGREESGPAPSGGNRLCQTPGSCVE